MKRITLISSLLIIGFLNPLQEQFTQEELFSGFDKTDFTVFSSNSLTKSQTLSLTTLAFFKFNYSSKTNRKNIPRIVLSINYINNFKS